MTQTQNDLFEVARKTVYIHESLLNPVAQNSIRKYPFNLPDSQKLNSNNYPFVVDWQIPKIKSYSIDKPPI